MTWDGALIVVAVALPNVALIALHIRDARRKAKAAPKRPPTLTEEYLRNRALNAMHRPKVRP